jgi:hypothetical protein
MRKRTLISLGVSASLTVVAAGVAVSAQDKYTLEVPGGLAFSEFRGYEDWSVIAISQNGPMIDMILGNPEMIAAKARPAMASPSRTAPRWQKSIGRQKNK